MSWHKRSGKYHAKRATVDGIDFHSEAEVYRYRELQLLEAAGIIRDLEAQGHAFTLVDGFKWRGKKIQGITYTPDFQYVDCETGRVTIEDVKANTKIRKDGTRHRGTQTEAFEMRAKLFKLRYPDIDFFIVHIDKKTGATVERFLHGFQERTRKTTRTSSKKRSASGTG